MKKKTRFRKSYFFIGVVLLLLITSYFFIFQSGYLLIKKNDREALIHKIKNSPSFPERFYFLYNQIYINSLEQGQIKYLLSQFANSNKRNECPCRLASFYSGLHHQYQISLPQLTFFLENFVSQKECLNYYVSKIYFWENVIGIENGASHLFGKEISDLTDKETIELILKMENPVLYNKSHNFERVNKLIESVYEDIKQ